MTVFTNAKYIANEAGEDTIIEVTIDGNKTSHVPVCVGNKHYDEIKVQVDSGNLTIQPSE